MVYTTSALWTNIFLNVSFRPVLLFFFFFLPVAKHYQSAFFFSLNLFRKHPDANYESFCKNLTLSTCLLSFVCDSILHSKNFQNISISFFGRGGGGGCFWGISTLKPTNINISHSTRLWDPFLKKTEQFHCIYLLNCSPFVSKKREIFFVVSGWNLLQFLLTMYCYRKSPERNSLALSY